MFLHKDDFSCRAYIFSPTPSGLIFPHWHYFIPNVQFFVVKTILPPAYTFFTISIILPPDVYIFRNRHYVSVEVFVHRRFYPRTFFHQVHYLTPDKPVFVRYYATLDIYALFTEKRRRRYPPPPLGV